MKAVCSVQCTAHSTQCTADAACTAGRAHRLEEHGVLLHALDVEGVVDGAVPGGKARWRQLGWPQAQRGRLRAARCMAAQRQHAANTPDH